MANDLQLEITDNITPTLQLYLAATKKDMRDIVNDFLRDVAYRAIQFTKAASLADINALPSKDWWSKYMSKRIYSGVQVNLRKRIYINNRMHAPTYRDQSNGQLYRYHVSRDRKGRQYYTTMSKRLHGGERGFITSRAGQQISRIRTKLGVGQGRRKHQGYLGELQREMQRVSRMILAARRRSVNFLRAGWIPAARIFAEATGRTYQRVSSRASYLAGTGGDRMQVGVAKGSGAPATSIENPVAIIRNAAVGRKSKTPGQGLATFGKQGLDAAIAFVQKDKHDYAERKLQATARKYSAAAGSLLGL